jgi:uncharacterized protein YyaL (SSP411 family)
MSTPLGTPPAAPPFSPELVHALTETAAGRPASWRPRTRHIVDGGPRFTNRLALESSPYLQQHAHNPVNWYAWGQEAFDDALALDRPVFLSIGYSTCHWCHVMEEESFEDEEIAAFINAHFIAIKVDREERPDVDAIYMAAVQAMTGHGGWPMTIFMDHERVPFFGGTYFPPHDGARGARRGFASILRILDDAWRNKRGEIDAGRAGVKATLTDMLSPGAPDDVDRGAVLSAALRQYKKRFDPRHGGLDVTQKFPSSLPVRFLMQYGARTGDNDALAMARTTLTAMAKGGIHDHVGGGFHRYSVDPYWLVPHFEKMLYDNALLLDAFVDGYTLFHDPLYLAAAEGIAEWVAREMTSPEGPFFSATDADSTAPNGAREEGWFFTWTPDEVRAELGDARADDVIRAYGVTAQGNFEGRTVLSIVTSDVENVLADAMHEARGVLLRAREERPPPLRDDKCLTSWNGLMIAALARAGRVLARPQFVEPAARAADAILARARTKGRLFRVLAHGHTKIHGLLDDHAFMCRALVELFQATSDPVYLTEARAFDTEIAIRFEDHTNGGYFTTPDDGEALLVREKPSHDGAEPSGASVHTMTLLLLAALTGDDTYRARADRAMRSVGEQLARAPHALSELLVAVDARESGVRELLLVGDDEQQLAPFVEALSRTYTPACVVVRATRASAAALARVTPLLEGRSPDKSGARAFVCESGTCALPSTTPDEMLTTLRAH